MSAIVLTDYLGRKVRFTTERRRHILKHHPEMMEWVDKIGKVLTHPERVVRSRSDPEAELYYVWQPQTRVGSKYSCVVVIVKKHDAFVLTPTSQILSRKDKFYGQETARSSVV